MWAHGKRAMRTTEEGQALAQVCARVWLSFVLERTGEMGLREDLAAVEQRLHKAIDRAMQTDVAEAAKSMLQESVAQNVYGAYAPEAYVRRGEQNGGLADRSVMEVSYSPAEHLLQVQDMSRDNGNGRLIAPVVEAGEGYTWYHAKIYKKQPFPRPFHQPAEEAMEKSGAFEQALRAGLSRDGF